MNATASAPAEALILAGEGYSLSIAPEAESLKADLIRSAGAITTVTSNEEADIARAELARLAELRILVEKSRKKIKDPVLKVGKDIDAQAATFVAAVEAEESRIKKLIGDHAAEVARQQREAARIAEEKRREAERLERERQRIEQERIAAEEKAKQEAVGKTGLAALKAAAAAEEEAEAKAAEAKKIEEAAAVVRADQNAAFGEALAAPTKGVSMVPDFEILDPAALYAAHPSLCKIEVLRAPVLERIKAYQAANGRLPEVPGLRVFEKPKVSAR